MYAGCFYVIESNMYCCVKITSIIEANRNLAIEWFASRIKDRIMQFIIMSILYSYNG